METILRPACASDNRIAIRNATYSIEASGNSAAKLADAACFVLCCAGLALIIKALR